MARGQFRKIGINLGGNGVGKLPVGIKGIPGPGREFRELQGIPSPGPPGNDSWRVQEKRDKCLWEYRELKVSQDRKSRELQGIPGSEELGNDSLGVLGKAG